MRYIVRALGLVLLLGKLTVALCQSPTYPIIVHTNGYIGQIAISGGKAFLLKKDTTLAMNVGKDGSYFINTGATIGDCKGLVTSYIYMSFHNDGTIDSASLCPKASVKLGKDRKSIYLQTSLITIHPGLFNRGWHPSYRLSPGYVYGKQTVRLIKGQTYSINQNDAVLDYNCHYDTVTKSVKRDSYTGSAFYFTVSTYGHVVQYGRDRISSVGYGKTLLFKTRRIAIDPREISQGKPITLGNSRPNVPPITRRSYRYFIPGVVGSVFYSDTLSYHFIPM